MRWGRWLMAVLPTLLVPLESPAQFIYPAPTNGFTVTYHRRPWTFAYFAPTPFPYLPPTTIISYRVITPPPIIYQVPRWTPDYDLTGVDLDLVPTKTPPPKPIEAPKPKVQPAPPKPPPPAPRMDPPIDEYTRLLELGITAFHAEEYGLALRRFKQAVEHEPGLSRGHFLLSQALFASGKYQAATAAIEAGMRLQPNWPSAEFHPRIELYKGHENSWELHLQRLAQAAKATPESPRLFLHAHQLWFDGQRAEAAVVFQKARQMAVDPTFIDAFLKAAGGAVAAK